MFFVHIMFYKIFRLHTSCFPIIASFAVASSVASNEKVSLNSDLKATSLKTWRPIHKIQTIINFSIASRRTSANYVPQVILAPGPPKYNLFYCFLNY